MFNNTGTKSFSVPGQRVGRIRIPLEDYLNQVVRVPALTSTADYSDISLFAVYYDVMMMSSTLCVFRSCSWQKRVIA